jgi:Na+-translocating ferredoxin:NAD+ oxidoreductase subunit B
VQPTANPSPASATEPAPGPTQPSALGPASVRVLASTGVLSLVDTLDAALPQTQCTRCGYPDCRAYAQAMAEQGEAINRCPPGGAEGIQRLAALTGRPALPLDATRGIEAPRALAVIDEAWCIGCTLCIKACPVDCIVGASKLMHTVIDSQCTGCELCLPVCPVDCIVMEPVTAPLTGWAAWSPQQAASAQQRYVARQQRVQRAAIENDERLAQKAQEKLADLEGASSLTDPAALERKRAVVAAAMLRARARQTP